MMSLLSASLSSATADDLWEKATKTHYNHQHYNITQPAQKPAPTVLFTSLQS